MRQQQRLLIINAPQLRPWLLVADRLIGMLVSGLKPRLSIGVWRADGRQSAAVHPNSAVGAPNGQSGLNAGLSARMAWVSVPLTPEAALSVGSIHLVM